MAKKKPKKKARKHVENVFEEPFFKYDKADLRDMAREVLFQMQQAGLRPASVFRRNTYLMLSVSSALMDERPPQHDLVGDKWQWSAAS